MYCSVGFGYSIAVNSGICHGLYLALLVPVIITQLVIPAMYVLGALKNREEYHRSRKVLVEVYGDMR